LLALPSNSSLSHYPENEPSDYTVRLANPISLDGRWEAALLEMSFPYEWHNVESVTGVHIISTMTPIQGDLSLLGDLLVAKQRQPPESGWYYEIEESAGGLNIQIKYDYVEVPRGDYSTPQELGNALANVVSEALSAKYRISQQEKLFQYHYNMRTRVGQYSIAHDRLSVFLVIELEDGQLATALRLTYRRVMSKITLPEERKLCEFLPELTDYIHPELAGLIPEKIKAEYRKMLTVIANSNRMRTEGPIVSFVSPEERPVYFLIGNAGKSMLRRASFVQDVGVDSIYVYSDIVEPQHVGDTIAPLLGIVPLKTTKCGSRQFFTFTSPIYLPLCKQQFSTVQIRLRTARGKPVPFPEGSTNVVCELHLRRYSPFI